MVGEFARVVALPDDPASPLRAPLSGEKRVAWSEPLDLQEVKTVSRALGCTVNDVLMATVAGALGAYLRAEGFDTQDVSLRASVPVNLREADEAMTLGNKFGLLFVELPVGVANPLQRAYTMHDTMRALKGSQQPPLTLTVLALLGMLPNVMQGPVLDLFSRKGSLVASNVPGPQAPLYLCGQRITQMYFWVPQSGSIGVGVSILSYAGEVFFGLIADRACIAEPAQVVDRLGPEFERLLLAATVGVLGLEQCAPTSSRPAQKPSKKVAGRKRTPAAGKSARRQRVPRTAGNT
jgi:WS/DGAT/MGAT family acyltransferase